MRRLEPSWGRLAPGCPLGHPELLPCECCPYAMKGEPLGVCWLGAPTGSTLGWDLRERVRKPACKPAHTSKLRHFFSPFL
eukprot:985613-Pelagomonas_calceolata.AAC.1